MSKSADAFRTISEVADWLGVQTHVLRFWESKFTQVKPVKRAGGRRYYRPADMLLLGGIRKLLHDDGLTIKGVQKILREEGMAHVSDMSPPLDDDTTGQLDGDLVAHVADLAELAASGPMDATPEDTEPEGIDQSPIKTLNDGPFVDAEDDSDAEDVGHDDAPPPFASDRPATVPTFMRSTETDIPTFAETEERGADVPTLTSDFTPQSDTSTPADAPQTPTDEADEATPSFLETPGPFGTHAEDTASEPESMPEPEAAPPPLFQNFDAPPDPDPTTVEVAEAARDQPAAPAAFEVAFEPEPEPEPETAPEPMPDAAPRPRIVDVPDDADIDDSDSAPSVLTRAAMLTRLTPAQRDAIRPLVAQLAALRDQMARSRRDPG